MKKQVKGQSALKERKKSWDVLPVVIHIFDLPLNEAVQALAVRSIRQPTDHAQPVRPLLSSKQLFNRNGDSLSSLLMAVDTHHFLL